MNDTDNGKCYQELNKGIVDVNDLAHVTKGDVRKPGGTDVHYTLFLYRYNGEVIKFQYDSLPPRNEDYETLIKCMVEGE